MFYPPTRIVPLKQYTPQGIYQTIKVPFVKMAARTSIQENLVAKNASYAENFTQGHLALPPAKKYAVGL